CCRAGGSAPSKLFGPTTALRCGPNGSAPTCLFTRSVLGGPPHTRVEANIAVTHTDEDVTYCTRQPVGLVEASTPHRRQRARESILTGVEVSSAQAVPGRKSPARPVYAREEGTVPTGSPCEVPWRVLLTKLYQRVCPTGAPFQTAVVQGRDRVLLQSDHDVGFQRTQRNDRPREVGGDGFEGGRGGPVAVTDQTPIVQITLHDRQAGRGEVFGQVLGHVPVRQGGTGKSMGTHVQAPLFHRPPQPCTDPLCRPLRTTQVSQTIQDIHHGGVGDVVRMRLDVQHDLGSACCGQQFVDQYQV